jgi:hypothetical protein
MMLRVHKDRTDAINLVDAVNDFVGNKNRSDARYYLACRFTETTSYH